MPVAPTVTDPFYKDIHDPNPVLIIHYLLAMTVMGGLTDQPNNKWKRGWICDPINEKIGYCKGTGD